ncbi:MAG: CoB--CoM heterodisulfide reductase subunit B [Promethearchaeota archaeon]
MLNYAFFPGCLISRRYPQIELATRKVMDRFGVKLINMNGASCCPDPIGIKSINSKAWMLVSARNLCIAEEMKKDIMTVCNGCFLTLKTTNFILKKNSALRQEINGFLAEVDKEFKGIIRVKHMSEILHKDLGIKRIKELIKHRLSNLDVAVHHGCHLVMPNDMLAIDNPERPYILDELVEVTGAKSAQYLHKNMCCGYGTSTNSKETSLEITKLKLFQMQRASVDCITLMCPSCFTQFDMGQIQIKRIFKESFDIPVIHYSQLLGLALGFLPKELGTHLNLVKVEPVLEKLGMLASNGG